MAPVAVPEHTEPRRLVDTRRRRRRRALRRSDVIPELRRLLPAESQPAEFRALQEFARPRVRLDVYVRAC